MPHHPIYYAEFSDLRKIIEKADNWRDVFEPILERQDVIIATLSEVEPIQNKVAHNRRATQGDLEIVTGACRKLSTAIGESRFRQLSSRCTSAPGIAEQLTRLRDEADAGFRACKGFAPVGEPTAWRDAAGSWWFDETYLGTDLLAVSDFFMALDEYSQLPRTRGSGHLMEDEPDLLAITRHEPAFEG